jgi:hypothetical protein
MVISSLKRLTSSSATTNTALYSFDGDEHRAVVSPENRLKSQPVNTTIADMSTKAQKTITGRDLRRGAPEEGLSPGESVMIEKKSGKLFELKRVDARPKSIVAAVDKIIEEVPIEGRRIKMDAVKAFLEDRE